MLNETSKTWLNAIRDDPSNQGWQRLLDLYGPFIRAILARRNIHGAEADDVVQAVLTVVVRRLKEFDRQREGSFRAWLRTITVNSLRNYSRSSARQAQGTGSDDVQQLLLQLDDPRSDISRYWNVEHDRFVLSYMFNQVKNEFRDRTWRAFEMLAIEERPVAEVCEELDITSNAAFIARSRVMKRLRSLADELLD